MKHFLKNCTIIDGSGKAPFRSGILINGEKILSIAEHPPAGFEGEVMDCTGLTATPGFIDCHSHNDWFALSENQSLYHDPFILQGITTLVAGNCGFSAAGYRKETAFENQIGGGLFPIDSATAEVPQMDSWFDAVDGSCRINMASLVGHGTARIGVNGIKNDPLSDESKQQMLDEIEKALQVGAAGVSLGLMYEPGIYSPYDELVEVAKLCVKYDKILTVHPRAESCISLSYSNPLKSHLLLALVELEKLVRETGVKLQHSHLIFVGRKTWKDEKKAVAKLKKLNSEGHDVAFDIYPLDYGASIITVILPDWYQAMSPAERKKKSTRLKLSVMINLTTKLLGFNFSDIRVAWGGESQPEVVGKTITEIAAERGIKPLDAYLDVCEKSNFEASVLMGGYQNDEILARLMENEQSLFMTDAWVEPQGKQNGAIYGAFPLFLEKGREMGWPLEKTVAKMTGLTASRFRLKDRGFLREGCYADINLIDMARLKSRIDEELPPLGIEKTFINGTLVSAGGNMKTDAGTPGQAVRVK